MTDRLTGHKLLEQVVHLDLKVVETKVQETTTPDRHVRMTLQEDPDILETCSFGLIFALGVLSFHDARPRGYSEKDFQPDDEWTVADMLDGLTFERGALHFYADYVRGRMMKTTVEIHEDGTIILDTVNRGEAATRWVTKLQGRKLLSVVPSDPAPAAN